MRIGLGYDVHQLRKGNPFILGGIKIPHHSGPEGHSDADVLTHAIIDALLGAMAWGDIGSWFPDTDPQYKNADSIRLLEEVLEKLKSEKVSINNIDATVIVQKPRLSKHFDEIRANLSSAMNIKKNQISVKATTSEKIGFIGREEGVAVHCVAALSVSGNI